VAEERLQKLIARAGVCSRRDADAMIIAGRVTVNGSVALAGTLADPARDAIKIDGKRIRPPQELRYLLVNKPPGVVTTSDDPAGRTTVLDLVKPRIRERVFPIGRLDYASEGLIILTNDGEFASRIAHPRFCIWREYRAKVRGIPDQGAKALLVRGTWVEGRKVVPKAVEMIRLTRTGRNSWWRVVVGEGRTHEVRDLFARVGHPVQRLVRVAIGGLRDEKLARGEWRELNGQEVDMLRSGGGGERKDGDARTEGAGVHAASVRLRPGQADRGSRARVGNHRDHQAGLQREPARKLTQGPRRHAAGDGEPQPLPRRRRVRAAPGGRRKTRI